MWRRRDNLQKCWQCRDAKHNHTMSPAVIYHLMWLSITLLPPLTLLYERGSPFIRLVKGRVYWPTNSLLRRPVWSRTQKRIRDSSGVLILKFIWVSQWGLRAAKVRESRAAQSPITHFVFKLKWHSSDNLSKSYSSTRKRGNEHMLMLILHAYVILVYASTLHRPQLYLQLFLTACVLCLDESLGIPWISTLTKGSKAFLLLGIGRLDPLITCRQIHSRDGWSVSEETEENEAAVQQKKLLQSPHCAVTLSLRRSCCDQRQTCMYLS